MGSIIKRGENTWLLKYDLERGSDGKRNQKYETFKGTKSAAKSLLAERETQLRQGTYVVTKDIKVGEWLQKWLTVHAEPHVTPKTFERYSQLVRVHILPNIGGIQLQKLTIPQIQAFYTKLYKEGLTAAKIARQANYKTKTEFTENEGLSPITIRHIHRVLSMALSEAVRGNEIYKNPAKEMKLPKFASKLSDKDGSEQAKAFSKKELDSLLNHFKGKPFYLIIATAVGTGMRQGEILGLRWTDLNFENCTIAVRRSVEDTKSGQRFKTPKSRKGREFKIDEGLMSLLKAHKKAQVETYFSMGFKHNSESLVFPRSPVEPDKPMNRHGLSRAVTSASEELGFAGHSFHSLRHTFASLCLTANPPVPLNIISQCLGHANVGITASIYSHFIGDDGNRAASAVGQFLAVGAGETLA